ncbi:S-layer homology domain-containing protein [Calothrix sp. UHCC 0171]|uniref:S-layer homology domain-containing protein n=1 Tax=Calothrix sp. UHCC 0171 TaxID=3110245 RepID=UPI002B1EE9DA|nr:S-layer homology domain-containing protein [Calothrix sp. UHCC 0171]MEA5571775.1 S-layer homology domain-containing protein [Calothrix sp. UHCC 0171]
MSSQIQLVIKAVSVTAVALLCWGSNQQSSFAQFPRQLLTPESTISQLNTSTTFTDITGVSGEKEIRQLAELGVLETTSGQFQPQAAITRSQFVTWLVKTYNQLHKQPIRLSENPTSAFPDVSNSHPHFTFIQSAHNAGFLAGFDDGNFRPDDILTREQMIALKTTLDSSINSSRSSDALRNFIGKTKGFTDVGQISEKYLPYIAFDLGNAASGRNFARVYGTTRIYAPQKAVTRAEAAILLSRFRRGGTVEQALKRRNK